jgi:hypothetical protein
LLLRFVGRIKKADRVRFESMPLAIFARDGNNAVPHHKEYQIRPLFSLARPK